MVRKLTLGAIWGNQRHPFPYKEFWCAPSVLHVASGVLQDSLGMCSEGLPLSKEKLIIYTTA